MRRTVGMVGLVFDDEQVLLGARLTWHPDRESSRGWKRRQLVMR